ncbi:hypothetical protein COI93_03510 [Bacillus cereus]|uniref:Uncharacterized protein n=1 Tax=Bacillus cereus TaxID=1396 RepID=A0A2B0MX95_BACCE|nr:hypothetical protein COI93_03510 [Bacillus cereus]
MTIYKRFSLMLFLVLFISLFTSTMMASNVGIGFLMSVIIYIPLYLLFLYIPFQFQEQVPMFHKYVEWMKLGGKWGRA